MNQLGRLQLEALKKFIKIRVNGNGHERLFRDITVVSGADGHCQCELQISESMLNSQGFLHGGVTATLVDSVSTFALMTTGAGVPGVSLDLSVSYLKPIKLNDSIIIDAKTLSCGKSIAVATVDITSKASGKLMAHGRHSKFVATTVVTGKSKI